MAAEPQSSSWHPALMPNSAADIISTKEDKVVPPRDSASTRNEKNAPTPDSPPNPTQRIKHDELDWLSNAEETVDDTPWLASEEPVSVSQDVIDQGDTSAATPNHVAGAQHSSSMSFARTVSHEISFNDDDEGDWAFSRTESDPFKMMAPAEHTNSFPTVPPAPEHDDFQVDRPLPSSQALDVLEETEQEDFNGTIITYGLGISEGDRPLDPHDAEINDSVQPIGGGMLIAEAETSATRYEEGLPLLDHSHIDASNEAEPRNHNDTSYLFEEPNVNVEQGDENDDFFSQIRETVNDDETSIPHIERKSTMQAMAAASPELLPDQALEGTVVASQQKNLDLSDILEEQGEGQTSSSDRELQVNAEDLTTKWQEAFAGDTDDEEFLPEDQGGAMQEFDASGFLGSDDEGLLDDDEVTVPNAQADVATTPSQGIMQQTQTGATGRYAPQLHQTPQLMPSASMPSLHSSYNATPPAALYRQASQFAQAPPAVPEQPKVASFVGKSKAGYTSPYDLPSDLVSSNVKPRKRASMQQLVREDTSALQRSILPPRSVTATSLEQSTPSAAQPATSNFGSPPQQKSPAKAKSKENFFEELPITSKPRPASRHSNRAPSPNHFTSTGPPPAVSTIGPPYGSQPPASDFQSEATEVSSQQSPDLGNLVAPARVNPYATLPSAHNVPPPAGNATRYSPAPGQPGKSTSAPPPASLNRYSPAPSTPRQNSAQSPPSSNAASQGFHPHLPRTSSPLAHFEISNDRTRPGSGDVAPTDRRTSSNYEPRLNRVSSLPPTTEVDEEEDATTLPDLRSTSATHLPPNMVQGSRYSPKPSASDVKTPIGMVAGSNAMSPPKRAGANYMLQTAPSQPGVNAPVRSQTISPGATRNFRQSSTQHESTTRPSTSHASTAPSITKAISQPAYVATGRPRGSSLSSSSVPPTDGRELDALQRWQGAPVVTWGFGGTMVTSFPKSVPRYTMNQSIPSVIRTCGEVKVRNFKDVDPLQERLARFPGPLKGKSKKKEVLSWLTSGIDALERQPRDTSPYSDLSLEEKRSVERLLLLKLLRVFVEHDGQLEGNPNVEKAVHDTLALEVGVSTSSDAALFTAAQALSVNQTSSITSMQADAVDTVYMDQIRQTLLNGERESAVWSAVDKRLWGHAMLIAHTVSAELYQQVAQEFVRKEVNHSGHSNESLGAFYKILSGNYDDCVDELVPVHARAGLQLLSTESSSGPTKDKMDGLEKWRETLTLVLNNRSTGDERGLKALGQLLSSYGRAEAAQICFIFSRKISTFGGIEDSNADFVLLGADHRKQSDQFAKETEALQLSEIYEYGLSLSAGAVSFGSPHLAAYKLQHALTLAEYGYRDKALQYCDAIVSAITAQTRRSPYYHHILEAAVDDLMRRLKQAPKEEASSWISKPSMNKVSDSMWNRFNKFVAGDENDPSRRGGAGEDEAGPFARIASTPNLSRSPSFNNFEMYGGPSPGYPASTAPPVVSATPSRYAPATGLNNPSVNSYEYAPQSQPGLSTSNGRNSNEYASTPYQPVSGAGSNHDGNTALPSSLVQGYPSFENSPQSGAHMSTSNAYQPPTSSGYQTLGLQESPHFTSTVDSSEAQNQVHQSATFNTSYFSTVTNSEENTTVESNPAGYEAPSFQPYGFEPPSYEPDPPSGDDEAPKPKKKSFMDDDEDDIPALRPQVKSKADIDRENADLIKKIAEEDAKRNAEQQGSKKGWGFSGWWGSGKKGEELAEPGKKPIRAKLGEANSFVYDPDLKRWINKAPGAENTEVSKPAPPPPKGISRSVSGTPPPPRMETPPLPSASNPIDGTSLGPSALAGPAPMARSASTTSASGPPTGPPSRPATSMSNASSIDDLLGPPGPRKAGQKKPRKSGRYVDVMAK